MTRNDFVAKIASLFSNQMDGDLILLIEQYLDVALADMAMMLIDEKNDKAEKFRKQLANQTWASSEFAMPADMLGHKQKQNSVLTLTVSSVKEPVFQVDDWQKLLLLPSSVTLGNHYCTLENGKFLIREKAGGTSGTNLNVNYYRTPTIDDVDEELQPILVANLLKYMPKSNG